MKKIFIYFLFIFFIFNIEGKGATFTYEETSRVLERCANVKFLTGLFFKIIPGWGKNAEEPYENTIQNDKQIQYYIKKYPINLMQHKNEINKKFEDLNKAYFEAVRSTVDINTQNEIDNFNKSYSKEDKSRKNVDKRFNFYEGLEYKSSNPEKVKSAKHDSDTYFDEFFFPLFEEHQMIVWASKSRYFDKMSLKDKLFIDEYKNNHLGCEQEFKKGKITFYEKWK